MALPQGNNPTVDGIWFRPFHVTPDDATPTVIGQNCIPPNAKSVVVDAVQNNTSDWIQLPSLSTVPDGHRIIICCNAGGAFKMRTPSGSNEKINNVDADDSASYQCTDTNVLFVVKMSTTAGWMAYEYTNLGAVVTAVVPS